MNHVKHSDHALCFTSFMGLIEEYKVACIHEFTNTIHHLRDGIVLSKSSFNKRACCKTSQYCFAIEYRLQLNTYFLSCINYYVKDICYC